MASVVTFFELRSHQVKIYGYFYPTRTHDKLFKEMESVKENARDLIESTFPEKLLKNLNLNTLKKKKL